MIAQLNLTPHLYKHLHLKKKLQDQFARNKFAMCKGIERK